MEVLLQRPWLPVSINGVQLLSKSCFGETEYHILLTDMKCVWEERMESADIEKRAQVHKNDIINQKYEALRFSIVLSHFKYPQN